MRYIDLQEAFELEVNELDSNLTKPSTSDTEYWLNAGLNKFTKTRYSGINFKKLGFEQDQKRIDDLRTLVSTKDYNFTVHRNEYDVKLPSDYMFTLGENAAIYSDDICWPKDAEGKPKLKNTDILEATIENIDRQKQNSLSEYRLHANSARPLRLYRGDRIHLYTDGEYHIGNYTLTYLRRPKKIDLTKDPFTEYNDMPVATHDEIVKLAVQLYLENKGNKRYETYSNEVSTME